MGWEIKGDSRWWYDPQLERFPDYLLEGRKIRGDPEDEWDPCCNPVHSWMLEQKMAELGWSYDWISFEAIQEGQKSHLGDAFFQKDDGSKEKYVMIGANRLHATALAADSIHTKDDPN